LPLDFLLLVDTLVEFFAAFLGAEFAVHSGMFLDAPNRRLAPPALVVALDLQFVAVSLCASAAGPGSFFFEVDSACVLCNQVHLSFGRLRVGASEACQSHSCYKGKQFHLV
jgi:hypothetical protein